MRHTIEYKEEVQSYVCLDCGMEFKSRRKMNSIIEFLGDVIAMDVDEETMTIKFIGGDQVGLMLRHLITETCNFTAKVMEKKMEPTMFKHKKKDCGCGGCRRDPPEMCECSHCSQIRKRRGERMSCDHRWVRLGILQNGNVEYGCAFCDDFEQREAKE